MSHAGLVPSARGLVFAALLFAAVTPMANAQETRFAIDSRASLAWWEINPNLSHLWATTCPQDPAWQPGEGRSMDAMVDYVRRNKATATHLSDTTKIPLYPRMVVRSLCTPSVSGEVITADTTTWQGTHGHVAVQTKDLVTGLDYRDEYARKAIYDSDSHPELFFHIDSLVNVRRSAAGDSLHANAVDTFEFRGVRTPMTIPVRATREGGGIRVRGQTHFPASHLTETYGISKMALGLSVGLKIWKDLYMGIDVILRPAPRDS